MHTAAPVWFKAAASWCSQSGSGACLLVDRRNQVASRKGKVGLGCLRNDRFRADFGFDERTRRMID